MTHLSNSNNFMSVSIQSGSVVAVSNFHHPSSTQFVIPVDKPENIKVESLHQVSS